MNVALLVVLIGLCGSGALGEVSEFFDSPRNETNPEIWEAVEELQAELKTATVRLAAVESQLGELEKQNTGNWFVLGTEWVTFLKDLHDVSQQFTRNGDRCHICSTV